MKYPHVFLANVVVTLIWLVLVLHSTHGADEADAADDSDDMYPKLLQFFPKNPNAAYTLNEKSTFTSALSTGWIIKAKTRVDLLLYMLVDETIRGLGDIRFGYVYFTTKTNECDLNLNKEQEDEEFAEREIHDYDYEEELEKKQKQKLTFKLRFLDGPRSKFVNNDKDLGARKNITLIAAETSIRLEYNSNKYFACLNFASKNASNRYFLHQGN